MSPILLNIKNNFIQTYLIYIFSFNQSKKNSNVAALLTKDSNLTP